MKRGYRNLSGFLRTLRETGELKRVERPVSPYLEISRMTDRESKSPGGGKALFFARVEGSPYPVVTNLFGSERRICLALGVSRLEDLTERMRRLIELRPPRGLRDTLALLPRVLPVTRCFPRRHLTGTPPCQEVVYRGEEVDLTRLPILHHWPKDAGPFITLPMVFTRSLKSGRRNTGMYRLQIFDRRTTGMHWHVHKDGAHFFREYRRARKRMPVAVAIGADPATIYAATAPMPRNGDEMLLAGFIRQRPVTMAKCLTVDMEVPAEAEFVLEGYVDPEERRLEGPFGDHTGYYSLPDEYPVFHVTALTHRKDPVYCSTLVGPPPMEDCYLGKATERLFLPFLQTLFPEMVDYWFPWEGAFHNGVVVSMEKEYPGHAQKLMYGLWGQGQLSFCKSILVMDEDVDLRNPEQILAKILHDFDITTDITFSRGILDVLDHASPTPIFGSKIGIDLTRRLPGEPPRHTPGESIEKGSIHGRRLLEGIREAIKGVTGCSPIAPCNGDGGGSHPRNRVLALGVEKDPKRGGRYFAGKLFDLPVLKGFNIILLFDPDVSFEKDSLLLWKLFHNVDPERDIFIRGGRLVVDACSKGPQDGHGREWPDELVFPDA
ncbi:MAG: menaquinone biosynthesis decarboxylase [Deltaproteobacteria bacterium]|nr:menaquinone biosynthesis decarboxylase [Deltaproteobacteria bacterium]